MVHEQTNYAIILFAELLSVVEEKVIEVVHYLQSLNVLETEVWMIEKEEEIVEDIEQVTENSMNID